MENKKKLTRRDFLVSAGGAAAGLAPWPPVGWEFWHLRRKEPLLICPNIPGQITLPNPLMWNGCGLRAQSITIKA